MKHDWIKLKRHPFVTCRRCFVAQTIRNGEGECLGWQFPPVEVTIGAYRYIREDMVQEADDAK